MDKKAEADITRIRGMAICPAERQTIRMKSKYERLLGKGLWTTTICGCQESDSQIRGELGTFRTGDQWAAGTSKWQITQDALEDSVRKREAEPSLGVSR
jgi:hypothetical protein